MMKRDSLREKLMRKNLPRTIHFYPFDPINRAIYTIPSNPSSHFSHYSFQPLHFPLYYRPNILMTALKGKNRGNMGIQISTTTFQDRDSINIVGYGLLVNEEKILVLEQDVLLLIAHLSVLEKVEHVLLSQEPLQEHPENFFHAHLLLLIRGDKKSQMSYTKDLFVSLSIVGLQFAEVAPVFQTKLLDCLAIVGIQEALDCLLCDVGANIFFIVAVLFLLGPNSFRDRGNAGWSRLRLGMKAAERGTLACRFFNLRGHERILKGGSIDINGDLPVQPVIQGLPLLGGKAILLEKQIELIFTVHLETLYNQKNKEAIKN